MAHSSIQSNLNEDELRHDDLVVIHLIHGLPVALLAYS